MTRMTRMTRVIGLILIVLGVIVGAVGAIPSGLAGRLNGVGGRDHLTADGLVLVGALLVLGGLFVALRRGPARPVRPGDAILDTAAAPPEATSAAPAPSRVGPEAPAAGEGASTLPPEAPPGVPPWPSQEGEEHEAR